MKQSFFKATLMMVAILAAGTMLTSCGNWDEGKLTVFYNVAISDDMAQLADMVVTYKLADGSTVTDTITGTSWDKEVVLDTFPAVFGIVDYTFIPRPANSLKKEVYETSVIFTMFTRETKYNLETELVHFNQVKSDKVASLIALANDHSNRGISKIATIEGDTISIKDNDPESEKIRIVNDNAIKKVFTN